MKTNLLVVVLSALLATGSIAQTATNFNARDCSDVTHDLFSELDAGKVVVLNWVMPCGACVPASLTTFNVVKSYQATNPNTVLYYLVDDLANTSCTSLISWGNSNHINADVAFSDASINMLDYGTESMPKVVVMAGGNHHVFMVADAEVDPTQLQDAIIAALATTGVPEAENQLAWVSVSQNPANDRMLLSIKTEKAIPVLAILFNIQGQNVGTIYNGTPSPGESKINVDLSQYLPGVYFIRVSDSERTGSIKLTIKK